MAEVWVQWHNAGQVFQSCFASVEDAQAQADAEPSRGKYLGVFDGPMESDPKKIADVKGAK